MNKRAKIFVLLATLIGASELSAAQAIPINPIPLNSVGLMALVNQTKTDTPITHETSLNTFGKVRTVFSTPEAKLNIASAFTGDATFTDRAKQAQPFLGNANGTFSIEILMVLASLLLCWLGSLSNPLSQIWIKSLKGKALPLAIVTLLTACGGGGEDNQSNVPSLPTQPIIPTTPELQVALTAINSMIENSSIDVPVTILGAQGDVKVQINQSGPEQLKVSQKITATGGNLHLQLGELFSNQQAQVDLSITDAKGRQKSVSLMLELNNTLGFHGVIAVSPVVGLELVEHTSINLDFIFDGAKGDVQVAIASTTKEADITTDMQLTNQGGRLSISSGELEYPNSSLQLELTFTDSAGEQQVWLQEIALLNMSDESTLSAFNQLLSATPAFLNLKTERELVHRLSSLATMINPSYTEPEDALSKQFTQLITNNGLNNDINQWISQHQDYEIRYHNGSLKESAITADHQALLTLLRQHASVIDGVMSDAVEATGGHAPVINLNNVYLDKTSGRLSRFIGHEALGHYQEHQWLFNTDYEFLTAIIFPESQSCHAE
jgi:hypothetical protein